MAKIRIEEQKEVIIYALISQISNEVYVGKVSSGNYYSAYKKHVNGESLQTEALFRKSEEKKSFPQMYDLERAKLTNKTAVNYCVAWTKYFMERGFQVLASEKILSYAQDPNEASMAVYMGIQHVSIDTVLSDEHLLKKEYQRREKNKSPKNEIKITVSHREYERIQKEAGRAKMTMSRYCKNEVLKGYVVSPASLPTLPIYEYMGEVREVKGILKQLLDAIYRTNKYYPADMENIQAMVDKISEQQKMLDKEFKDYIKEIKKILPC